MRTKRRLAVATATCLIVASCFPFSGGHEKLNEEYYLGASDIREQMSLYRSLDNGAGIGRVPATVFAVGWNASHVIAKRHPPGERAVTEYYIVVVAKDHDLADPADCVIGPLSSDEFLTARLELGVDDKLSFSRVLRDLE